MILVTNLPVMVVDREVMLSIVFNRLTCNPIHLFFIAMMLIASSASAAAQSVPDTVSGNSRGYLTTPQELRAIKQKADQGLQPYAAAVSDVLSDAGRQWSYQLNASYSCGGADDPRWIDNDGGAEIVYSKALAYHLTGNSSYAQEVKAILEDVMSKVKEISTGSRQCQLNFAWGTPEFVAAADLIEDYWAGMTCLGPSSTTYGENQITNGNCKVRFQNWLVKNPYYIVSMTHGINNWGTAAAVTTGTIADYLWDRPDVVLVHRNPRYINDGRSFRFSAREAYAYTRQHMLDSMNGHAVSYGSSKSCDLMETSPDQDPNLGPPVKSQITENGILPADARRQQKCNITIYNGDYQNYPQINLDNLVSYCEFLQRRGDTSCFDNVENSDVPNFRFADKNGRSWSTHLRPGRGSIERALNAIIIDSNTQWKRKGGLWVAVRYYRLHKRLAGTDMSRWSQYLEKKGSGGCSQSICYGALTHGFATGENPGAPPTVPPPDGFVPEDPPSPPDIVPPEPDFPPTAPEGLEIVSIDIDRTPSGDGPSIVVMADARVSRSRTDRNYGSSDYLRLREASSGWRSYLKFDVSGVVFPVSRAVLRLYVTDESNSAGSVYWVSNNFKDTQQPWDESSVTWDNAPSIAASALDSHGSVQVGEWVEFDVTSAVVGNGMLSFALVTESGNSVLYSSKEGTHPPQLVIEEVIQP